MTINQTAPMESGCASRGSLLPGLWAAAAMLLYAAAEVIGLLFYNWSGASTLFMLPLGAFVYLGTMGFLQWKASRR